MRNKLFVLITLSMLLCSCTPSDIGFSEIDRKVSPDGKVDAVIVESNGGATTSFGYLIFVVPTGKTISRAEMDFSVFRSDHTSGLSIDWIANHKLHIQYDRARIFSYTNFQRSKEIEGYSYLIEIFLRNNSDEHLLDEHDQKWTGQD